MARSSGWPPPAVPRCGSRQCPPCQRSRQSFATSRRSKPADPEFPAARIVGSGDSSTLAARQRPPESPTTSPREPTPGGAGGYLNSPPFAFGVEICITFFGATARGEARSAPEKVQRALPEHEREPEAGTHTRSSSPGGARRRRRVSESAGLPPIQQRRHPSNATTVGLRPHRKCQSTRTVSSKAGTNAGRRVGPLASNPSRVPANVTARRSSVLARARPRITAAHRAQHHTACIRSKRI